MPDNQPLSGTGVGQVTGAVPQQCGALATPLEGHHSD